VQPDQPATTAEPAATVGQIVLYTLGPGDATQIDRQQPMNSPPRRNPVAAGHIYPAVITAVWSAGCANLVVLLDGDGTYWATSRTAGDGQGHWTPRP
jgi:hypothetical protein